MLSSQLFDVVLGNAHVVTWAYNREDATRKASKWLGGNMEEYIVTPITAPGDRIHLDITLYV